MHERKKEMENKKTIIGIVVITILIVGLIAISYFYNDFNTKQIALLTEEANKILETDLIEYNVDFDIIGASYYPYWHGTFEQFFANVNMCQKEFNKEVMVLLYLVIE